MAKQKESRFRGTVAYDSQKQRNFGTSYVNLPKGVKFFNPEPGERSKFDIIPYIVTDKKHPCKDEAHGIAMPGDIWYRRPYRTHKNVGVDKETIVCPTSFGKPCPICEYRSKRFDEGADKKELEAMNTSERNLYAVIPIGMKDFEETVHVMDISRFCFQTELKEELKEHPDFEIFPDLEEGLTLNVRFSSETVGAKGKPFPKANRIDFKKRDYSYEESMLDDVPKLDDVFVVLSYDEIKEKFWEQDQDETSDERVVEVDDDERPKKSLRREKDEDSEPERKVPVRRSKTNDDIDEEEKPVRRRREEPEEDEEPKYSKKRKYSEEDEDIPCVACEGTGLDSRGRECPVCEGSGIKPERKRRDEEEDQPKKLPTRRREEAEPERKVKPSSNDNDCPKGHVFGKDFDTFKDCDTCQEYDNCEEAEKKLKRK
jgi:hypothetical protein